MEPLPQKVSATFTRLKAEFNFPTALRKLNGHFYIYRATSWWDKTAKKVRSSQEYLGKISTDGVFTKKLALCEDKELERAKAVIFARGGFINFPEKHMGSNQADFSLDETDKKLLMALSMNAKAHIPQIAESTGLDVSTAEHRIKNWKRDAVSSATFKINVEKLGYTPYLLFYKIRGRCSHLRRT